MNLLIFHISLPQNSDSRSILHDPQFCYIHLFILPYTRTFQLQFFFITAKQADQQSSESENEELKNMERKEKKQVHKVKKLISKKKEQVNKSIAKKMKKNKSAA